MEVVKRTLSMGSNRFHPLVQTLTKDLDVIAPRFELEQGQIDVIYDPKDFYKTLKEKISAANRRIFLSSLYIGKGQGELIECISNAVTKKPGLKVHILTDALRGTREAPSKSSATLLAQLLEEHSDQIEIRMYQTPHLNGLAKLLVPKRFNEGFGLQHMKIYGFDDEVILSGANLSSDYFTNRQDRYYLFKSKDLSDYYFKVQTTVGLLSYKLKYSIAKAGFDLFWPKTNPLREPASGKKEFIQGSSRILTELLSFRPHSKLVTGASKTVVYPISQFTPIMTSDMSTEKRSVLTLLKYISNPEVKWNFTAGYFNMLPEIKERLLSVKSFGSVITASPLANGFYKSPGISGNLPDAYLYLSKLFLRDVYKKQKQNQILLKEWVRGVVNTPNGWSYHAKGLWATAPNEEEPSISIIGSSNYTKRAYNFDLETNAVIITNDTLLKSKMKNELNNILSHTNDMKIDDFDKEERKVSPFVILATKILGKRL